VREIRSLFVVHDAPYPPRSGAPLRSWQLINLLAENGPVHVFSVGLREQDATMPKAAGWTHIDPADFPVRSHGIVPAILRAIRPREFPIENDYVTGIVNRRLRTLVRDLDPNLIVVSHWHDALPSAVKGRHRLVADVHNVESDLARQLWMDSNGTLTLRRRYRLAQWRRRERAFLRNVDQIWSCSADDARRLRSIDATFPPIEVVPNAIDVDSYDRNRSTSLHVRPTIGYVGFYGYKPNADAASALIDDIFPAVKAARPGTRLVLIGRSPTERMQRAAANDADIVVTGSVDDVRDYLPEIDVLAVPLLSGSGTRLKILEAFAARVPVVSTAKGAEGLDVTPGKQIEICEIPAMASRILVLVADEERRRRQVLAAHELVTARYSWTSVAQSLRTLLEVDAPR
jgi:glycosyltransferase involved in cell wall biosynthesis